MFRLFNLLAVFAFLLMFSNSCTEKKAIKTVPKIDNKTVPKIESNTVIDIDEKTVIDIDGNEYDIIKIGTQTWMVDNLKTTKFNDGTSIPYVSDGTEWSELITPGYSFYNNDIADKKTYGALYNWYAVNSCKIAPKGWHVPTDAEWTTLENYLIAKGFNYDGTTTDNKIAKSIAASSGWKSDPTRGAIGNDLTKNNTSGFAGLPGGCRSYDGTFDYIGDFGGWWSSTQYSTGLAWVRLLFFNYGNVDRYSDSSKQYGFSIRCVRD